MTEPVAAHLSARALIEDALLWKFRSRNQDILASL